MTGFRDLAGKGPNSAQKHPVLRANRHTGQTSGVRWYYTIFIQLIYFPGYPSYFPLRVKITFVSNPLGVDARMRHTF
jgi:hypothetical protein